MTREEIKEEFCNFTGFSMYEMGCEGEYIEWLENQIIYLTPNTQSGTTPNQPEQNP